MKAQHPSFRRFGAMLLFAALAMVASGLACGQTAKDLDKMDETDGAT